MMFQVKKSENLEDYLEDYIKIMRVKFYDENCLIETFDIFRICIITIFRDILST